MGLYRIITGETTTKDSTDIRGYSDMGKLTV